MDRVLGAGRARESNPYLDAISKLASAGEMPETKAEVIRIVRAHDKFSSTSNFNN
jgi:hypothetical protein